MPNQWRHISEAPKDGTRVDLWAKGERYPDMAWIGGHEAQWSGPMANYEGWGYVTDPTHFMFLPEPPNIEG